MSAPVDVVLHIGSGKTGTTSIQQFLRRHPEQLAARGILYPRSPGRTRHTRLGLAVLPDAALAHSQDWLAGDHPEPEVFRRRFRRRLLREVAESGARRVVLSDEGLYHVSAEAVGNLRELLGGFAGSVRLVVYLRRQDDHLVSRYQQVVKMGEVRPLAAWARTDFARTYDYHRRLVLWRDTLAPDAFVVRPFERDRFAGGSLLRDFLDAAGLDVEPGTGTAAVERNVSLGAEAVELLRILNLHRSENLGLRRWEIDNRPLVARLARTDTGAPLTLPEADLDRFMDRWAESNRLVAQELLGDPSGQLFRAPRKAGGTPVQRLDPARLDHYLDLLELPPGERAPVRELAAREAERVLTGDR